MEIHWWGEFLKLLIVWLKQVCTFNCLISRFMRYHKLLTSKIALVQPLDGYYSFNLYHMQPAIFLLWLIGVLVPCFDIRVVVQPCFKQKKLTFILCASNFFSNFLLLHRNTSPIIQYRNFLQLPTNKLTMPINFKNGNNWQSVSR
jgi:hypothetical protein